MHEINWKHLRSALFSIFFIMVNNVTTQAHEYKIGSLQEPKTWTKIVKKTDIQKRRNNEL